MFNGCVYILFSVQCLNDISGFMKRCSEYARMISKIHYASTCERLCRNARVSSLCYKYNSSIALPIETHRFHYIWCDERNSPTDEDRVCSRTAPWQGKSGKEALASKLKRPREEHVRATNVLSSYYIGLNGCGTAGSTTHCDCDYDWDKSLATAVCTGA